MIKKDEIEKLIEKRVLNEVIIKILKAFGMKIILRDEKIINSKEILALNEKISPYYFEIKGAYIALKDENGNEVDSIDLYD